MSDGVVVLWKAGRFPLGADDMTTNKKRDRSSERGRHNGSDLSCSLRNLLIKHRSVPSMSMILQRVKAFTCMPLDDARPGRP